MQELLGVEVWMASLALACAIGWLIGDRGAALRVPDTLPDEEVDETPFFSLTFETETARVPPTDGEVGRGAPCPAPPVPEARPVARRSFTGGGTLAMRRRRQFFEEMPPLAELHEQTGAIRQSVKIWDAPDLTDRLDIIMRRLDGDTHSVLRRYRASIKELAECNRATQTDPSLVEMAYEAS